MTGSLAEIQRSFAHALADLDAALPTGLSAADALNTKRRFAVYRNNVAVSLVDALVDAFLVTSTLVGEEFFRAMARAFVRENRPRSPILHCYGSAFPAFIASFEPARAVPYLADVARIEVAWTTSYHAADASPCQPSDLAALGDSVAEARALLLPSVRLVRSAYPAGSIWLAHQPDGSGAAPACWSPETTLVWRPAMDVSVKVLEASQGEFTVALARGCTIAEAAAAALSTDANFDIGAALVDLVLAGAIQKFEKEKTQ